MQMTITKAILAVMHDCGVPLLPKDVYKKIAEKGLYVFHTPTPVRVVTGQIRRQCKDIDFPSADSVKYFGLTNDGRFYPLKSPVRIGTANAGKCRHVLAGKPSAPSVLRDLEEMHRLHRVAIKEQLLRDLKRLAPAAFELFAKNLLVAYGFEDVHVTNVGRDGGIDGYGRLKVGLAYMRVAFQCKRWTRSNVGRPEVAKFRGDIQGEYEQGIFFTTASFVAGAKAVSFKPGAVPIVLIDGASVVELMIEKEFGVKRESLPVYTYALDLVISDESTGRKM